MPLLRPDDIIWIHDYHLIPSPKPAASWACATASASSCTSVSGAGNPHRHPAAQRPAQDACYYDLIGFQTDTDRLAFQDYITREVRGVIEPDGSPTAYGQNFRAGVTPSVWCRTRSSSSPKAASGPRASHAPRHRHTPPDHHQRRPAGLPKGLGALPRLRGIPRPLPGAPQQRRVPADRANLALRRAHLPAHPRAAREPGRAPQRAHVRPRLDAAALPEQELRPPRADGLRSAPPTSASSPAARRHEPRRQGIRRRP